MEVDLNVSVVRKQRGMSEARRESRPWFSIPASEARCGQYLKCVAPSRVANEQVDIAKRSQRRIGINTMGQGRSLQHNRIHSGRFERSRCHEQVALQVDRVKHLLTLRDEKLVHLLVRERDQTFLDRMHCQPSQALPCDLREDPRPCGRIDFHRLLQRLVDQTCPHDD
jgi:hypothetical protein